MHCNLTSVGIMLTFSAVFVQQLVICAISQPHTEDVQDIAASIKALAKSVHGDTVFGDLPRPRFSTQI